MLIAFKAELDMAARANQGKCHVLVKFIQPSMRCFVGLTCWTAGVLRSAVTLNTGRSTTHPHQLQQNYPGQLCPAQLLASRNCHSKRFHH